jgi:NAD(P)-dependent dehydrogenase (short-subunit alcohol dehydrogenase family)
VPGVGDVRREEDVQRAIDTAAERPGGVDLCVNNASAIAVEPTELLSANPRATSAEGKP